MIRFALFAGGLYLAWVAPNTLLRDFPDWYGIHSIFIGAIMVFISIVMDVPKIPAARNIIRRALYSLNNGALAAILIAAILVALLIAGA